MLVVFAAGLLSSSCGKDDNDSSGIPLVPVNIIIYANDPEFINVAVPGGWDYITGGSQGIIIYRKSNDEFTALDRHSTFEPGENCRVEVDATGIKVVDPCSDSEFLLFDGSVTKGPASIPLKQYRTEFDGSVLRIFN